VVLCKPQDLGKTQYKGSLEAQPINGVNRIPNIVCSSCHNDIFVNIPLIKDFLNIFTNVACSVSYWQLLNTQAVAV